MSTRFCTSVTALSWDGILCYGCREALENVITRQKHFDALEKAEKRVSNHQDGPVIPEDSEDLEGLEDAVEDADQWTALSHGHDDPDDSNHSKDSDQYDDSNGHEYSESYEHSKPQQSSEHSSQDADDTLIPMSCSHDYASLNRCALLSCRLCAIVLALSLEHARASSHLRLINSEFPVSNGWTQAGDDWDYHMRIGFTYSSSITTHAPSDETTIEETVYFVKLRDNEVIPSDRGLRVARGLPATDIPSDCGIDSPPMLNESTSSYRTLERLLNWTRVCIGTHTACQQWRDLGKIAKSLPTRLLAISPGQSHVLVKLVSGAMLPRESQYTTLSHCWGGFLPLRLSTSNIEDFKREIPWEQLPQTFKDAAIVTSGLGITYLWIDALCIVQDSTSDWLHEASRMAAVYTNSYLNISADASSNPDGGLFRDRDPIPVEAFYIPASPKDSDISDYCCYRDEWIKMVEASSLSHRAWVLQERYLAPRVVHFAAHQIYWECCSRRTSEGLPLYFDLDEWGDYKAFLSKHHLDTENLNRWTIIMHQYSKGRLTNTFDRPLALAGLARAFCNNMNMEVTDYKCGLWRPTFIHDLMWHCPRFEQSSSFESHVEISTSVPTWSWLSVDHQVDRSFIIKLTRPVAELVEVETKPLGDPFGLVADAFARIRAPMCVASVTTKQNGEWIIGLDAGYFSTDPFVSFNGTGNSGVVYPDGHSERAVLLDCQRPKYFLLLGLQGAFFNDIGTTDATLWPWCNRDEKLLPDGTDSGFDRNLDCYCLIVVPTGGKGEFRRIGIMVFEFWDLEVVPEFLRIWTLLERQFRSYDVPKELYEEVDDRSFYTITLV